MLLHINDFREPAFNLALEEILALSGVERFLLWRNAPSVILGRHQNIAAEVAANCPVPVFRRMSGGGAVYHDDGNWNLSWLNGDASSPIWAPLRELFLTLGVEPRFSPPNDLELCGVKISGAAEYRIGTAHVRHASLLVRTNLSMLSHCLTPPREKLQRKGVPSVRARVGNLAELANYQGSMEDFGMLANKAIATYFGTPWSDVDPELRIQAEALANSKYRTREWNNATF